MDFLDLMGISHQHMEILNPSTPEKIIKLGKMLGMKEGSRVIDFGSGCAEPLALWATEFGIRGIGVDISADFCRRAREKLAARGLSDRIEIVHVAGAEYTFEPGTFDAATCIGATFVFGGYRPTVQAMRRAIGPHGRLGVGEVYWSGDAVPPEYAQRETACHTEWQLLQMTREEGFELEYVSRASPDDWDRYLSDNWHALLQWLEAHPGHPDRDQVFRHLRSDQDDYLRYQRKCMGWATWVLKPAG